MNYVNISDFPKLDYASNEAMNTLCTNLFYCGDNIRSVIITSRYEQEGKSQISMNMLRTIASCGKRVALVDADLRCSALVRRYKFEYGCKEVYGVAEYLAGMCSIEDIVFETNFENAYILPAGREVLNSVQLLASPRYKQMMDVLRQEFDVVLVDTPPAGVIVDAVEIAKHCDGALIIVAYNTGRKQEIAEVAASIQKTGCRVLGAVLNEVDLDTMQNRRYYYRSGRYSSYYRYGYSKTSRDERPKKK